MQPYYKHSIHQDIGDPYSQAQTCLTQVSNIWDTTSCLRKVLRFVQLSEKLHTLDKHKNKYDISKASILLFQCETMLKEYPFMRKVNRINDEIEWLTTKGKQLRNQSRKALLNGIKTIVS